MSYALLFSGQGTQHPGMLPWLESSPACAPALHCLVDAVGPDWRAQLDDAGTRSCNAYAQPLIVGTALAAWAALAALLPEPPVALAGYSVGELAAFACAGVLSGPQAVELAVQRAALMDAAVAGLQTGLLSVSGLRAEQVLQPHSELECAIALGPEQGIYAGELVALNACAAGLSAQGAVCRLLEVRVASHARWMASAAQGFAALLEPISFVRPHAALVPNASGASTRDPATLRRALSTQIATTVQWAASMDALAEQGVGCVLEVGARSTLSKLWNQRHPAIPARCIAEFRDAAGAARWLQRASA